MLPMERPYLPVNSEDKDRLHAIISEYKLQYLAGIDESAEIK